MTYDDTPDMPSDVPCREINPKLWTEFQKIMLKFTGHMPTVNWSEAEVVQWIDLELDKYLHDTLVKNPR